MNNDVIRGPGGELYFKGSSRGTGTADAATDMRLNTETYWIEAKINGTWVPKIQCVAFGA